MGAELLSLLVMELSRMVRFYIIHLCVMKSEAVL